VTSPSRAFAPLDFAQLIAIAVIWGANNIAAKIAVDAFPPMMSAALRFGIVLAVLAPWLLAPLKQPDGRAFLAMLAFSGPVHFAVLYTGLRMAEDIAPMVVAMQLWAPASVALAAMILGERAGPLRWLGVAIAFIGTVSLNFDPAVFAQLDALLVCGLGSSIYGLGAVFMRRVAPMSAWGMQAWVAAATAPPLALASLMFESNHAEAAASAPWTAWAATLFGALVSSILASTMLFRLVQKYEVSRTTPYLLLTPLVSFALAWTILGDDITAQILAGAALTMAGVALVALAERRRA
jgi:O-acetylserine/cysteine efflux transporter